MADEMEITRVFDAPREQVWKEWTEPERFADWYGGAQAEIPLETVDMDVREGGTWKCTMVFGEREIHWRGEYREVVPPERLVLTVTDQPGDDREIVEVVLVDLGGGRTEMRKRQYGGGRGPGEYEATKRGWGKFFDRMEERLSGA